MLYFKAKMHKIDLFWGSAPDLLGELTALPKPLAGFKWRYFYRRGWEGTSSSRKIFLATPLV